MRSRGIVFAGLLALCAIGATVAIVLGARQGDAAASGTSDALARAASAERPTVLFRNTKVDRGTLGLATPGDPVTGRTTLPLRCERVAFEVKSGICLTRGGGFADGYQARIFGTDLKFHGSVDVQGIPSRARVSPDGRFGTVTLFVTGDSYAAAGMFSTRTTLIDLAAGAEIADLEQFTITKDGRSVTTVDRNFWGVTFAPGDSDRFYATMATGGKTYLIQGSVSGRDGSRDPRERRVPVALPGRHADRLQEAHRLRHHALAPHRARPRDDARDAARGVPQHRRPGRVARR